MSEDEIRKNYLIEWRKGLWTQIRQKEDAIWRFISFYAGALILAAGFLQGSDASQGINITFNGSVSLLLTLFVVTLWGILIILDANYWMQRNLLFVGNIEREILEPSDFGKLIPSYYANLAGYRYSRAYEIHYYIFIFAIFLVLIAFSWLVINEMPVSGGVEIILVASFAILYSFGLSITTERDIGWVNEFTKVRKDAPGKELNSSQYPDNYYRAKAYWSSPVVKWNWVCSLLSFGLFTSFAVMYQPIIIFQPWVKVIPISVSILIIIVELIVRNRTNRLDLSDCKNELKLNEESNCVSVIENKFLRFNQIINYCSRLVIIIWIIFLIYNVFIVVTNIL